MPAATAPPPVRGAGAAATAAVAAAAGALYLASVPVGSDALVLGNDVVHYAVGLARGGAHAFWNPHHLLQHPLAAAVARALALGGEVDVATALRAQQIVSAIGGALAVAVVFRTAARVAGAAAGLAVAAAFGLSAGTWLYAGVGETYLPATAALAALLAEGVEARLGRRPWRAARLAGWLLLACLLRQDSVLAVPALLVLAPFARGTAAVLAAGAASLALYAGAWLASGSHAGFGAWLRGLADSGLWGAEPDLAAFAYAAAVTGLAFHYGLLFGAAWKAHCAAAWALAVLGAWPRRGASAAAVATGVPRAAAALALFAATRFGFFAWWQPGNMEYHAGTLLPLALLAALGLGARGAPSPRRLALVGSAAALAATANLALLVGPNRDGEIGRRTRAVLAAAGDGGLVVALDRLQHLALLREAPERRELLDGSELAPEALLAAASERLASGRAVALVVDRVVPRRTRTAEKPLDPELVDAVAALGASETLAAPDGELYALVVRPAGEGGP